MIYITIYQYIVAALQTYKCMINSLYLFKSQKTQAHSNLATFSSYKNQSTLKALIAIASSGALSFISDLFGGNKELTARCGLLDYLEEGDAVMADRWFNIHDLLEAKGVTLNIPPKLTDSSGGQFSESDRVKTRRIASVCIHVERAIGQIKFLEYWNQYLIQCITWPISYFLCV